MGVGVVCVFVYIIGLGGMFVRACILAPKYFGQPGFQMRWKFLLIKFHAGAYWWGIVFLAKNFLINLSFVISSRPVARLYLIMFVATIYLSGIVIIVPYRARYSNAFEAVVALCIIYVSSLLTWQTFEADGGSGDVMANVTVGISFIPITFLPLLLFRVFMLGKRIPSTGRERKNAEQTFAIIKHGFEALVALDDVTGTEAMLKMGDVEIYWLGLAASVCNVELVGGSKASRITDFSLGTMARERVSTRSTLSSQNSSLPRTTRSSNRCVLITV
mmetsp:Transcript_47682/g.147412  ORF Transcript_47682/g.147412 Transcript_47682/m.147412 type:complete len:274 (+) Transcript_47682:1-822(+)